MHMNIVFLHIFYSFIAFLLVLPFSFAESHSCLSVYREGGAPAVFKSPSCPRWTFPSADDLRRRRPPPGCHLAFLRGRRPYQEDRAVCALDIKIPFLGRTGVKEVNTGIIAVFDGHNGAEASDMASKYLLDYFFLHAYFLLDVTYSVVLRKSAEMLSCGMEPNANFEGLHLDTRLWNNLDQERLGWMSPIIFDGTFHLEILKESLLRTIHDIDATFSKEALRKNLVSGSTATVVLLADGQILAANIGDSKSLLCSENFHISDRKGGNDSKINRRMRANGYLSPTSGYERFQLAKSTGPTFHVKELTKDHHPDRDEERNRVEAAGGYVLEWAGVPRVNGELAISRAIGDIPFKRYGVIATPEMTDWQSLTNNDSFLVAASDGIFEKMTTQDVCDLLWDEKVRAGRKSNVRHSNYLADCIVDAAFRKGTVDNMAAVVVPLRYTGSSEFFIEDECDQEGTSDLLSFRLHALDGESAKDATSTSLMPMEYYDQIISKFNRLLVEKKHESLGCFYLSENLNEDVDYIFEAPDDYQRDEVHDLHPSHPEAVAFHQSEGSVDLYKDQQLCWHFGMHDGDKGKCTSPEVFANFLGLLDSIPYSNSATNSSESSGQLPDFRYVLKRRFDRGSYGEVWLAFHWNCSEGYRPSSPTRKSFTPFSGDLHLNPFGSNMKTHTDSSVNHCFNDSSNDNLFILKRIMVERGKPVYLSGLREKYFGEIFLNASTVQGLTSRSRRVVSAEETLDSSDLLRRNLSDIDEVNFTRTFSRNSSTIDNNEEGLKHIARFVESFESDAKEIWLVFRHEGQSLSKLIYTVEETKTVAGDERKIRNVQILRPSAWWYWLRTTEEGASEMQEITRQLLLAVKSCHDRNITHRDIKPENMIICFEDADSGKCSREIPTVGKRYHLKMRIIDFGSAIDEFTLKHLYGSGPSRSEQTFEYTPPEALLNASWFEEPTSVTLKYDMWSVGVVMLELIIGSPHIFQISDRTRALLDRQLEGWSEHTKELAYKLRSYMEMCILIPGVSPQKHQKKGPVNPGGVWLASWKCSEESFSDQVKSRDPLKLGFPTVWALRLVRQLLMWHPEDRLSVDDALQHPYFQKRSQTHTQSGN